MQFTSWAFLLFLAVLLPVYYLVPKRMQWIVLLLFDALFVCAAGTLGAVLMLVTIGTVYGAARLLDALFAQQKTRIAAMKQTHTKEERKRERLRFERKRRRRRSKALPPRAPCSIPNGACLRSSTPERRSAANF